MAPRVLTRAAAGLATIVVATGLAPGGGGIAHAAALAGLPAYDHVVVLVLENENESATYDPKGPAKYLNAMRAQGAFDPEYFATGHASLDNYVQMVSGQGPNGLTDLDCMGLSLWTCVQPQSIYSGGRNLADQLEAAGKSWKGYMDSMPSPCFHGAYSPTAGADPYQGNSTSPPAGNYADRHDPFVYFADVVGNDARCRAHVVPYTRLATDIAANAVPNFSFVTPDTCHDGHDTPTCADGSTGGLAAADAWMSKNVPSLLTYLRSHNGLLLITSDEASASDFSGCCSGGPCLVVCTGLLPGFGGAVGLVALGPHVKAGQVATKYDHASLLRTIEDLFGISEHLNNAAAAADMADLFTSPGSSGGTTTGATRGTGAGGGVAGSGAGLPGTSGLAGATFPWVALALLTAIGTATALRRRRGRHAAPGRT